MAALKRAIRDADGILLATPEYNWGTSGALKNAIDWASRDREEGSLMGKPATMVGARGRSGTARAQMQLQQVLAETGSVVMVKPGVLVEAFAPQTFDDQANLTAPNIRDVLARHLDEFGAWIRRVGRPRDFVRFQCEMDIQLAAR